MGKYFIILFLLLYLPSVDAQYVKGKLIHEMDEFILTSDNYVPYDRFLGFKESSIEEKRRGRYLKKGVIVYGEVIKFDSIKGEWLSVYHYKTRDSIYYCSFCIDMKYIAKIPYGLFKYIGQGIGEEYGLSTGDTLYGRIYPKRTHVEVEIFKNNRLISTRKQLVIDKTDLEIINPDYIIGDIEEIDVVDKKRNAEWFLWLSLLIIAGIATFLGLFVGFTTRDEVSISQGNILVNNKTRLTLNYINGIVTNFNVEKTIKTTVERIGETLHYSTDTSYKSTIILKSDNKRYEIVRDYSINLDIFKEEPIYCLDGKLSGGVNKNLPFIIILLPRLNEYIKVPKRYFWQITYSILEIKKITWFVMGCLLSIILTPLIAYQLHSKYLTSVEIQLNDFYTKGDYLLNIIVISIFLSFMAIILSKLVRTFRIKSKVTELIKNYFNSNIQR